MKIKIISIPPGFAPEEIRKQWIGVVIPCIGQEDKNNPGKNRSGTENIGGYQVKPIDAINALRESGKEEAAEFWGPYSMAQNFTFKTEVCEVVED